jgi:hypothetical protein
MSARNGNWATLGKKLFGFTKPDLSVGKQSTYPNRVSVSRLFRDAGTPRQATISSQYLSLQKELHRNPQYGVASIAYAPLVRKIADELRARSISDYGAGKQNLKRALHQLGKTDFEYFPYDPAFPEYGEPRAADLVCCIDVLEHIEPEYLAAVLSELGSIVRRAGFFAIATGPAQKILADGRNAHLIQRPSSFWLPLLCEYFEVNHLEQAERAFWLIVESRRN